MDFIGTYLHDLGIDYTKTNKGALIATIEGNNRLNIDY